MLREWTGSKLIFGITILILMLSAGACSSQAAPTPQPSQPSMDPGEVQALVEAAVEAAVSKSAARSSDEISQQELREMMAEVLAEASPVPSKADLADLVAKSIKKELAARPAPISQADLADLVAKSIKKELAARSAPISQADVERIIQTEMVGLQVAVKVTPKPTAEVRKPTIVFSDLTWDSVRLQNRIAMFIVEQGYGYPVDAISGKTQVLWHNLLDGDSLVTMEVWLPNQQEDWDAAIIDGAIIPLGKSLDENWQGWVIPTYMTKNNIELQHVTDINDEDYIDLFVAPGKISERPKKAVLVTCPVDTECHDINLAKLKAYKLEDNVEMIVPASLADLQDSLDRAYLDERPWLGYMWGPTRLSEELDLTILGEPDYNEECWATTKGCAYPTAQVLVAVHPSMLSVAPEVVEFLRKWDFTAKRQTGTEKWMNENNATTEEAAIHFLNAWSSTWTKWVPKEVAQRVLQAIAEEIDSPVFDVVACRLTRATKLPIEFVFAGSVPTGFDGDNRADCSFNQAVEKVTVVLTGPATHSETFTFPEPTTQVPFPLPEDTLSVSTGEILPPGTYHRKITVTSVEGQTVVISDLPSVVKEVTILSPQN